MCSISGIINTRPLIADGVQVVEAMNRTLRHRGPDDHGVWTTGNAFDASCAVTLGNTRLAIIDTSSAGHQPM